jgi:hypothetical protein
MLCLFLDDLLGRFIPRRDAELYSPGGTSDDQGGSDNRRFSIEH